MAEDWVNDLAQFGADAVSKACGEWRVTQSRRPAIADIVKLAREAQSQTEFEALPRPQYTEGELDHMARQVADKWARDQGYSGIDAWMDDPRSGRDLAVQVAPGKKGIRYFRKRAGDLAPEEMLRPTGFEE